MSIFSKIQLNKFFWPIIILSLVINLGNATYLFLKSRNMLYVLELIPKGVEKTNSSQLSKINLLKISPGSDFFVVTSTWGNTIEIWERKTNKRISLADPHNLRIKQIIFPNQDSSYLITSGELGATYWNIEMKKKLSFIPYKFTNKNKNADHFLLSPSGNFLANLGNITESDSKKSIQRGYIQTSDLGQFQNQCSFSGEYLEHATMTFSRDNRIFAIILPYITKLIDVKQCKTLLILKAVNRNSYDDLALEIAVMARRNNGFPDENGFLDYSMEFSPDSNHLVVNDNTKIKVYNLRQQNSTKILDEAKGEESWKCIAVSPDGKLVLGGGDKGTIKIWDLKTGTLTKTFKYHPVPIQALAIDPKTNKLISISADNLIREWKL